MHVYPKITPGQTPQELAKTLKKAAFQALDNTKRGEGAVVVPANALIDMCLAYQDKEPTQ